MTEKQKIEKRQKLEMIAMFATFLSLFLCCISQAFECLGFTTIAVFCFIPMFITTLFVFGLVASDLIRTKD